MRQTYADGIAWGEAAAQLTFELIDRSWGRPGRATKP
jgi:hypothetical protein